MKRNARGVDWWRAAAVRAVLFSGALMALGSPGARPFERAYQVHVTLASGPIVRGFGVAVCALGVALCVWARRTLGRDWGTPMSLKEQPHLVTTGPYAVVRHPIYAGVLLGLAGSVLAGGLPWLVILMLVAGYFIYSARTEERLLSRALPDAYPAYRRRTKMLIPFVW